MIGRQYSHSCSVESAPCRQQK